MELGAGSWESLDGFHHAVSKVTSLPKLFSVFSILFARKRERRDQRVIFLIGAKSFLPIKHGKYTPAWVVCE